MREPAFRSVIRALEMVFLAEPHVAHKLCQPNDVVVNTMWAWMAALGVVRQCGIVSPSYAVYRPISDNGLLSEYVDRLLRTPEYAAEYLCASTGINTSRLRLYPEQFLRIPTWSPARLTFGRQRLIYRTRPRRLRKKDSWLRVRRNTLLPTSMTRKQRPLHERRRVLPKA